MNIIVEKKYSITNNQYLINLGSEKTKSIDYLNIICNAMQINEFKTIKEYFSFLFLLNCEKDHSLFLSNKNKKEYMNYLKNKIKLIQKYNTDYFDNVYATRDILLSKLKKLDNCTKPVYGHNSATGRSKIISGTNFMTMKKEKRKELSFGKNKLFEVDFNSCEPYFYLLANKKIKSNVIDVYSEIENSLGIKNKNRKQLKNAIISVLYGAQYNTVKSISNFSKKEYSDLLSYLNIDNFSASLFKKIDEKGYMLNFYNRPVIVANKRLAVNYWVQSSVADFCYLAFNNFIDKHRLNFHAIIHDAIICSSENIEQDIKSIKYLSCPVSNFKIPVSFHMF